MVRLKNRYLLVNILYPDSHGPFSSTNVPDLVSFHQSTTDDLSPQLLLKAIRAVVMENFGDYGSGAIADSLSGEPLYPLKEYLLNHWISQSNTFHQQLQLL